MNDKENQKTRVRNMEKLNKESKAYKNSVILEMEHEDEVEFAWTEGHEEGREEGLEEGRAEAMLEVAIAMKKNGLPLGDIMLYTGLTEQQIQSLP